MNFLNLMKIINQLKIKLTTKPITMNTKITSIAAIMAAGAMAADNERVCCTLYTEAGYEG